MKRHIIERLGVAIVDKPKNCGTVNSSSLKSLLQHIPRVAFVWLRHPAYFDPKE